MGIGNDLTSAANALLRELHALKQCYAEHPESPEFTRQTLESIALIREYIQLQRHALECSLFEEDHEAVRYLLNLQIDLCLLIERECTLVPFGEH